MTPDELTQIGNLFDNKTAEMRRYVDQSTAETKRHFDEKAAEMGRHFDEKAAETQRHFDVVAESLRADIRIVAEGHVMLNEKMDRMREDLQGQQGGIRGSIDHLACEFTEFRNETRTNFDELRSAIRFSYAELDRRVSTLESELASLSHRLDRVEALVAH